LYQLEIRNSINSRYFLNLSGIEQNAGAYSNSIDGRGYQSLYIINMGMAKAINRFLGLSRFVCPAVPHLEESARDA